MAATSPTAVAAERPLILVTGASGQTGAAVVRQLRSGGMAVRAIVRRADGRSAALARLGVEIVVADLFDASAMVAALRGVKRAYFVPPMHPLAVQAAVVFANAARGTKEATGGPSLATLVGLSQWLARPTSPSLLSRQHAQIDELFFGLADCGADAHLVWGGVVNSWLPHLGSGSPALWRLPPPLHSSLLVHV